MKVYYLVLLLRFLVLIQHITIEYKPSSCWSHRTRSPVRRQRLPATHVARLGRPIKFYGADNWCNYFIRAKLTNSTILETGNKFHLTFLGNFKVSTWIFICCFVSIEYDANDGNFTLVPSLGIFFVWRLFIWEKTTFIEEPYYSWIVYNDLGNPF